MKTQITSHRFEDISTKKKYLVRCYLGGENYIEILLVDDDNNTLQCKKYDTFHLALQKLKTTSICLFLELFEINIKYSGTKIDF